MCVIITCIREFHKYISIPVLTMCLLLVHLLQMNQQCKVCGEPAAGFHFGAFTCEGCKVMDKLLTSIYAFRGF